MKTAGFLALWWMLASGCAATAPQASTMPDAEHSKSLETFAREMFTRLDQGDYAYLKKLACPDAVMFDTDEKGAPTAAWGKAAVDQVLDHYATVIPPGALSSHIQRIYCEADSGLGFCAFEFDQSLTNNGETSAPMKLRGTLTAMMYKGHWIWTSWHGSAREATATPSEPAPAAAAL